MKQRLSVTQANDLTAGDALRAMTAGELSSVQLVEDCLARIDRREPQVRAWSVVAAEAAREQARLRDRERQRGLANGVLHGVPVGIKDIIYTRDMPTQHNSPLYQDYWPHYDAACVAMLRNAGAIILGKAETVEFASMGRVAATRNPHDLSRTPGGSSSGSAAAVADFMVPLTLGTQTGGSTIRPASYCGVYAMKPTYGLIPIEGMRPYAPSLDTLGLMARSLEDLGLFCRALCVIEKPLESLAQTPRIGLLRTSLWAEAEASSQCAVMEAASKIEAQGIEVDEIQSQVDFALLNEAQDTVMHGEGRRSFLAEYGRCKSQLHPDTLAEAENTLGIEGEQIRRAYDFIARSRMQIETEMQGYTAWLTPAVIGEAPAGQQSTGAATFNRCWTALHTPCITVPASRGQSGMPVGVQFVAPRFRDRQLLTAVGACDATIRLSD